MERTLRALAAAGVLFGAVWAGNTALAQKTGGVLKVYFFDSPASMSVHEEATIAAQGPMMGGSPWYTVLYQFAQGMGARCAFEIDANGIIANSRKTGGRSGRSRRPFIVVNVFLERCANSGKWR
jgi:hypothetical protein